MQLFGHWRSFALSSVLLLFLCSGAFSQQLLDDFNRANSALVGGTWTEGGTGSQGSINTNRLRINTGGASGRDWVVQDVSPYYGTQLASNSCALEWAFNMRQSRTNPSGLNGSNYGVVFILAGSNANPTLGQGYAVILGQSGTTDPLRLVRYNGGVDNNANVTTIISYSDFGNQYLDIRVTYDPAGDIWSMYVESNGTTGPFGDPLLATTLAGTAANGTYTGLNLPYVACIWNHATGISEHALFDNVYVPDNCAPATPSVNFTAGATSGLEAALGTFNVSLSIVPTVATAVTVDISITNGPGVVYGGGNDYTTFPAGGTGSFTVTIPPNASGVNFSVTVIDDAVIEPTETVTFNIVAVSATAIIGGNDEHVLSIGDDDSPPTTLDRGDLIIVGINANNGSCSGAGGEDEISFFCFKDITANTILDLTDNGYERCNAGVWGDTEGTIRATRTGPTIPAGTVITFRVSGTGSYSSIGPDGLWSFASLNGGANLAMNSGGDQIFFLQGGTWINPPGAHNAIYSGGQVLYGFSTNNAFPWTAVCATSSGGTQRSNLPPQMECFSMAPTSATDYAKYTGPIGATNQRGWIIRIGNQANWSTYVNCSQYNTTGPNYAGGYTFSFTTTGFTPGLWTGATDTDWFECTNWDDAQVPDASIDVRIDDSAFRNCDVATGATAECNNLVIDLAGAVNRVLSVESASQLDIGGDLTITIANGANADGTARTRTGGRIIVNNVSLSGSSPAVAGEAILRNQEVGSLLDIAGDMVINPGGRLDLQGAGVGGVMQLAGNFINNNNEAAFEDFQSRIVMDGSGPQAIGGSLPDIEVFHDLEFNKPLDDVTFDHLVNIRGDFNFLSGRALNTNKIVFLSGSTASNMSNVSFAVGPIEKLGTDPFSFPVGKGNFFRPLQVTGLSNGNSSSGLVCEYYLVDPVVPFNNVLEPSLDHISRCEYWYLDRTSGSLNAFVTLSWDSNTSCGVTDINDLRVARFNSTLWENEGATATIGNLTAGTLRSDNQLNDFGPFTLSSISTENPLPVELLSFQATAVGEQVRLDWITATEINNDRFVVERSQNGIEFEDVLTVAGQGNSSSTHVYQEWDQRPLVGLTYYRLAQYDSDGSLEHSDMVAVQFRNDGTLHVWLSHGQLNIVHSNQNERYVVLDGSGRTVHSGLLRDQRLDRVSMLGLAKGIYTILVGDGSVSSRFIH